jgi:hypothetical protein
MNMRVNRPHRPAAGGTSRVTSRRRSATKTKRPRRQTPITGRRDALVRVGAVLGGFALLVGLATLFPASGDESRAAAQLVRVPVDQAILACPESAFAKGTTTTEVTAVAAPARLDDVAAGEASPGTNTGGELSIGELAGGKARGRWRPARVRGSSRVPPRDRHAACPRRRAPTRARSSGSSARAARSGGTAGSTSATPTTRPPRST